VGGDGRCKVWRSCRSSSIGIAIVSITLYYLIVISIREREENVEYIYLVNVG